MVYNTRIKTFENTKQVTIYSKTFTREEEESKIQKNKNLRKDYKNKDRTEQEERNCQNVSIKQTKNRIYDIARANTWEWFITLTFDRKKKDSSEYDEVVRALHIYLANLQQRQCPDLKYLIVPELHADGEHYHFHGLLANCDNLNFVFSGKYDRKKHLPIYNIQNWRIGWTTATRVQDTHRVSSYITKYITKDCVKILKNKKRYYTSHNIDKPVVDYTVLDKDSFIKSTMGDIAYYKTIDVKQAGMQVSYYEFNPLE